MAVFRTVDLLLLRKETDIPWGFRVTGGAHLPAFISSVSFGAHASRWLSAGDRVLRIDGRSVGGLRQSELDGILFGCGRELRIVVEKVDGRRNGGPRSVSIMMMGPVSGLEARVVSRKQQHQTANPAGGDAPQGAPVPPPPPPPPPSLPGALPGRRLKTEIPERGLEPPPAIQNAMLTKDKKPFTYTPGGLDLSEIKSPKMARRINRNACAEEMTGRPAPTTAAPPPVPASQQTPPDVPYSAMQSQLPTSVLPAPGVIPPPPPPPPPPTGPSSGVSVPVTSAPAPKPPALHKPPQMSFDPNEILARANRSAQEARPARKEEPTQPSPKIQNEPGQIYVPPVATVKVEDPPVVVPAQPTRGQLGSIYVPPVTNQDQSPTSSYSGGYKVHTPSPVASSPVSPPTSAEVKAPPPWVTAQRTPQSTPPAWMSGRQQQQSQPQQQQQQQQQPLPESPKPQGTRIIPIQIEGRDTPRQQQQSQQQQQQQQQQQSYHVQQTVQQQQPTYQAQQQQHSPVYQAQQTFHNRPEETRPHTRVIPIQIEGTSQTVQNQPSPQYHSRFNPMTPQSPTPYTPPSASDKEQKPQWAPVQSRPYAESPFQQQQQQQQQQQRTTPQPQYEYGTYNTAGVPVSQLRKMQLSDDDRALMDKFKSQVEKHQNDAITDENANPRYRGGHIPSRVFKMLDESVDDETYLHRESDPRYRGAVIPSRAFRLLQNMTDTAGDLPQVPKGPMRTNVSRPPPSPQDPPAGPYVPASEQQVQEPRKYTGGSIPSRSFRMLQQMTGQEIAALNHASSTSGRNTPVSGTGRWCPSPMLPPVDPYWYMYNPDPYLAYGNYVSDASPYGYYLPPQTYPRVYSYPPPRHHNCVSDSEEQSGYSSTDEMGQYYANYRNRVNCSPFPWGSARSTTPSILITPVTKNSVEDVKPPPDDGSGESESEEESEEEDTEEEEEEEDEEEENANDCRTPSLKTLKSVSDVGVYASDSAATVTNEEHDEEEDDDSDEEEEEEEDSSEISQGNNNLPHQLSVIYEESEHSDADSMRQKETSSATKSVTSESDVSHVEESDDDAIDTESSVTVRLPLRLKFGRGENDEDVTTVIVGDSEVRRSDEDEDGADVSVTFSLPSRSNSVVEKPREDYEVDAISQKADDPVPEDCRNSGRLSCESKTEESDSSSASADTVVKHRGEDTDEDEEDGREKMEDFKSWLNTKNGIDWKDETGEKEETVVDVASVNDDETGEVPGINDEEAGAGVKPDTVKKQNSQEESEDDSGVTSDLSAKHLASETDVDTESDYSELSKMTRCQRASTHSRLFKLLQEECGVEDAVPPAKDASHESLAARKEKLTLPLNPSSEAESLSSSSGVTSPSSPTVTDRLVKELVHSLLHKKKGKKFRKLPLAKLHAAALRILQEDMDPYDTSSGDDAALLLSPIRPSAKHSPAVTPEMESTKSTANLYGANYYDYLDYYNTWGNATEYYPESEHEIVPSKAFRSLNAGEGVKAKCPRVVERNGDDAASGRRTPSAPTTPRIPDETDFLSFSDKRERVAKVLEKSGK